MTHARIASVPLSEMRILTICAARIFLFATFMTVAATIPLIIGEWELSAAAAGSIVTSFTLGYAISLFVFAWASDHVGAKRMANLSAIAAAVSSLAFGLFARDWWSAMVLYGVVGLAQGGVYTPIVMIFADEVEPVRRGNAMGWLIASTSFGYAASLATAGLGVALGGWQMAFVLTGLLPGLGAVMLVASLRTVPNRIHDRAVDVRVGDELLGNRETRLLTAGYVSHCWELLGMWAWIPAFLAAALAIGGMEVAGASVSSAYLSGVLHLFGATAAFSMGRLSDRTGRRPLLISVALGGALISFGIGWMVHAPPPLLIATVFVYAFFCIGDSPVLTTALSEAVRPGYFGAVLAWRGFAGFIVGAIAPLAFGLVLDAARLAGAGPAGSWGLGFATLGLGGAGAVVFAATLRRRGG